MANQSLLDLALQHDNAIRDRRSLASPRTAKGTTIHLSGPAHLRRDPGAISLILEHYPAKITVWYLDPRTGDWTHPPHLRSDYACWAEYAKIAYDERNYRRLHHDA